MQPTEASKTDPAAGVVPVPRPSAAWRVIAVEQLSEMCLRVTFVDGTSGEARLREFIESSQVTGTIFEALRDPEMFRRAHVELGAITWPNGADLAPDAMYDAIRAHGHWNVGD